MIIDERSITNDLKYRFGSNSDMEPPFDLNDPKVINAISGIKHITIIFKEDDTKESVENSFKQLSELIKKLPNLEGLRVVPKIHDVAEEIDATDLIECAVTNNVDWIVIYNFKYDYDKIRDIILNANKELDIVLSSPKDSKTSLKYIFDEEKIRRQLSFPQMTSDELESLFYDLIRGIIKYEDYKKYKNYLNNYSGLHISIGNVSELSAEDALKLGKDSHLSGVKIRCDDSNSVYSFSEYIKIRKTIDDIVLKVNLPSEYDSSREKIIFAQIYKILAKNIKYDHYAATKEGQKDKILQWNCRNLLNGLTGTKRGGKRQRLTVCAGFASILQNVCSCLDITCDYIESYPERKGPTPVAGHAYNAVYLDGKPYLCDLTWDAEYIHLDELGEYFLKSYDEFLQSHGSVGFGTNTMTLIDQDGEKNYSPDFSYYTDSVSYEEQIKLFGIIAKDNLEEMMNEGYLAGFVMQNIEYIKQVKGKVGMEEYLKLIQQVHSLEDYIVSRKFKELDSWFKLVSSTRVTDKDGKVLGIGSFTYYPGAMVLPKHEAVSEVRVMEERQWKIKNR